MAELWRGVLRKMAATGHDPVAYTLVDAGDADNRLDLAERIGDDLGLRFGGRIVCVLCGRELKKSYGQGWCYPCSQDRAEADLCIVRPELCHHGETDHPCRDEDFARRNCFRPHVLYASLTSGCKVGITRRANVPQRWIDQGAVMAIPLAELPDRRSVGRLEHRLAESFRDRTHWMTMLKREHPDGDLPAFAAEILAQLEDWGVPGILPASQRAPQTFRYPVIRYPEKVRSLNLDKTPTIGGRLEGIKGQYLVFADGVINLRKFSGYAVSLMSDT